MHGSPGRSTSNEASLDTPTCSCSGPARRSAIPVPDGCLFGRKAVPRGRGRLPQAPHRSRVRGRYAGGPEQRDPALRVHPNHAEPASGDRSRIPLPAQAGTGRDADSYPAARHGWRRDQRHPVLRAERRRRALSGLRGSDLQLHHGCLHGPHGGGVPLPRARPGLPCGRHRARRAIADPSLRRRRFRRIRPVQLHRSGLLERRQGQEQLEESARSRNRRLGCVSLRTPAGAGVLGSLQWARPRRGISLPRHRELAVHLGMLLGHPFARRRS